VDVCIPIKTDGQAPEIAIKFAMTHLAGGVSFEWTANPRGCVMNAQTKAIILASPLSPTNTEGRHKVRHPRSLKLFFVKVLVSLPIER
jgi:hypothetical protein